VRRWRVADRSVANETFDTGGHIVPREHARIMIIVAAEVRGVQSSQVHQKRGGAEFSDSDSKHSRQDAQVAQPPVPWRHTA
jgi:hypothetical protein